MTPPGADLARQQRLFNAFRWEYNAERPHAALDGDRPGTRYMSSGRPYDGTLPPLEYRAHYLVKRVTNAGTIRFKDRLLLFANALKQHHVGLEARGGWDVVALPRSRTHRNDR